MVWTMLLGELKQQLMVKLISLKTVTSGTDVTFADGNGTTAEVTKDNNGITVKYNAKSWRWLED